MQATVHWLHHFWGSYCASIYARFEHEHTAKVFAERILGDGSKVKKTDDGYAALIFVKDDEDEKLKERIEAARIPDDRCSRCGERHEVADLAHSVDSAVPVVVDFGTVEHPGQQTLFP